MKTKLKRIMLILSILATPAILGELLTYHPKAVLYALLGVMVMILLITLWHISGLIFEDKN